MAVGVYLTVIWLLGFSPLITPCVLRLGTLLKAFFDESQHKFAHALLISHQLSDYASNDCGSEAIA